jgi:uncharacterized repeat protein (TIGR02543 family)
MDCRAAIAAPGDVCEAIQKNVIPSNLFANWEMVVIFAIKLINTPLIYMDMNKKIYFILSICLLCFAQAQARTEYNINAGNVTITANGEYRIYGNGAKTGNRIRVDSGVVADIILENVNLEVIGYTSFDMRGATVTLRLSGENTLESSGHYAGLHAPLGNTLTITSASGDGFTDGTLNATGGIWGAGIGGYVTEDGGDITISGGTVNATGGEEAAGIGGGKSGFGWTIFISGGAVNATGGSGGAGIGGGLRGRSGRITIAGGTVIASGKDGGAGIGGGNNNNNGTGIISIIGAPIIFATTIEGTPSYPRNGIATGSDVNIDHLGKTIALNADFIVPQNALLTIPAGWTFNKNNKELINNGTIINNGTLRSSLPLYTVSFNTNGHGTILNSIRNIVEGSHLAAIKPYPEAEEGYLFIEWYKESECTNPWNFVSDTVSSDITLYAKWTSVPEDITKHNLYDASITIDTDGWYRIYGDFTKSIFYYGILRSYPDITNTIKVNSGVNATIILENVNIDVSGSTNACAFNMSGANVKLYVAGVNTLKSGNAAAGLQAPEGSTLTITSITGDGSTIGTLNATGGKGTTAGGAGIGGGDGSSGGTVTILGGTVNATGGTNGAGIGGSSRHNGGTTTISGGRVTATGGSAGVTNGGAGIGGGWRGSGGINYGRHCNCHRQRLCRGYWRHQQQSRRRRR